MKIHEYGRWTEVANYDPYKGRIWRIYRIAGHQDPATIRSNDDRVHYSTRWITHGTYTEIK